jgi:hypothetical protein
VATAAASWHFLWGFTQLRTVGANIDTVARRVIGSLTLSTAACAMPPLIAKFVHHDEIADTRFSVLSFLGAAAARTAFCGGAVDMFDVSLYASAFSLAATLLGEAISAAKALPSKE